MFSLSSRSLFQGAESGGMKTVISFSMQVMFAWCHMSFCWEISIAKQAGGPNVLIKQRCDYPVCLCSDEWMFACVVEERKRNACLLGVPELSTCKISHQNRLALT